MDAEPGPGPADPGGQPSGAWKCRSLVLALPQICHLCTWARAGPHAATSVPVAGPGVMMTLEISTSRCGDQCVVAHTDAGFVKLRLVKVVGLRI